MLAKIIQKTVWPAAVCVLCMGLFSCRQEQEPLVTDFSFSCNILRPSTVWPSDWQLTDAQQKVLALKGAPAFVRLWYTPAGEVMRQSERDVYMHWRKKTWTQLKRSWLYLNSNEEYEFISANYYEVHPLSDQMKTLCKRGDPEDLHLFEQGGDLPVVEWIYYSTGERYKFQDGRLLIKEHFTPLRNFMRY